jgi:hypothetical protein
VTIKNEKLYYKISTGNIKHKIFGINHHIKIDVRLNSACEATYVSQKWGRNQHTDTILRKGANYLSLQETKY